MVISDEELDKLIKDDIEKDINQKDSLDDKAIEQRLGEMGFLWSVVQDKLKNDGTCFSCKKNIDFAKEVINVREVSNAEKGVIAFVSICDECVKKVEKEGEKNA
jgi:hypothetical protein